MGGRIRLCVVVLTLLMIQPDDASAGMPSFTLADVRRSLSLSNLTRMRLEVISFFLLSILLCAGIIQFIWNSLRKDFPILPRLNFLFLDGSVRFVRTPTDPAVLRRMSLAPELSDPR
jgi:prepilin-type processing-associated H-X9-DG protein